MMKATAATVVLHNSFDMIIREKRYFVVLNVLGSESRHALLPEVQWFVEAVVQESVVQGVWV